MANNLARSLGVRLEIVKTSWPGLQSDLQADRFDIAMGGITITLDRQKAGLFSTPVFSSGKTPDRPVRGRGEIPDRGAGSTRRACASSSIRAAPMSASTMRICGT